MNKRSRRFHAAGNDGRSREPLITRRNLRDIVILVCALSAVFYNLNKVQLAVSLLLLGFGCAFHYVTKGVLVRNVVLCREGAYSFVRHPYYMANYLIDSSFCLLSGNIYLLLVYPFLFYWSYGPTIRNEENFLAGLYGEQYVRHSLDVPQIFPDAHSIKNIREIIRGFSTQRITRNEVSRFMRFWATALFIVFVHSVKQEFLADMNGIFFIGDHYCEASLLAAVLMLSVVSVLIRSKKEPVKREPQDRS